MSSKVFYGGVPTDADIKLLDNIDIRPGADIPYETIETLIRVNRKNSRFWTVTNRWRKKLFRERHYQVVARGGVFHVEAGGESDVTAHKEINHGFRKVGRAVVKLEAVREEELSPEELQFHTRLRRNGHILLDVFSKVKKDIASPPKVESLFSFAAPAE